MSSLLSDSLPPVNLPTGSANRVLTPSKPRSITPVISTKKAAASFRGRSSSAPRSNQLEHLAFFQSIHNDSSRYLSRRKQRECSSINLLAQSKLPTDEHFLDSLFEEGPIQSYVVETSSNFTELMKEANKDKLESFRLCKSDSHVGSVQAPSTKRSFRKDEWALAEKLWINRVEKRLRGIVSKSLLASRALYDFTLALERYLLYFIETNGHLMVTENLSSAFRDMLAWPPAVQDDSSLHIMLKESPFHRLLVHAVCQFYGLHSKSLMVLRGCTKGKVILIKRTKLSEQIPMLAARRQDYDYVTRLHEPITSSVSHDDSCTSELSNLSLVAYIFSSGHK